MKFSERWLRSWVDPELTSEELADLLTMAGHEVEGRTAVAPPFDGVVVGEVTAVEPHPDASRLHVCRVDVGTEVLQVVCGAPNVRVGMKSPCARVGAVLPGATIGKATMRGVESFGMLCSARELGIGDDQSGLLELDAAARPGASLREYLDLDDECFTLKLTPNRGDCLSIRGLAREVAALARAVVTPVMPTVVPATTDERRDVFLEAGAACPRYCGRIVSGLDIAARTPDWMVRRLERAGVRPISAVVDITNYVMLELGQPLHAFDLDRLRGGVHVRFARAGERLTLLNGREITLDASQLVIADDAKPVALAGVMGGEASGVGVDTKAVFLESAFFAPDVIAKTARGLEMASDAAHRFERGVDFGLANVAIERATELLVRICGGHVGPVTEAVGALPARAPVMLRHERIGRVLGVSIPIEEAAAMLRRLELNVMREGGDLLVTPPSFRFDISIEEDLIEEVARLHGYNNIAASLPAAQAPMLPVPESMRAIGALKQTLAARDYFEVVTFSFVDRELEADFAGVSDPVALANPIASQMAVMRSTLLGSLVECVRFNVARKQDRVRLFEVAQCFRRNSAGFDQDERVAGICLGPALAEQWGIESRGVDFYDVRADVEALLGAHKARFVACDHPAFHPGQAAEVWLGDACAGWIGALHPRLVQKYELPGTAVGFELRTAEICRTAIPAFRPVSKFPPVRRDIAVLVDSAVLTADLVATIARAGGHRVADVVLFDVYRGKGVVEGRKSLAFRVLLQDTEKTLTDAEVEGVMQRIVDNLKLNHGATLRS